MDTNRALSDCGTAHSYVACRSRCQRAPAQIKVRFQRDRVVFTLVERAVHEAVMAAQTEEAAHGMLHRDGDADRPCACLARPPRRTSSPKVGAASIWSTGALRTSG